MAHTEKHQLGGHNLEVPLFNAAGALNGDNPQRLLADTGTLCQTDVAAVEPGSFTVYSQSGNEAIYGGPTFDYDPQTGIATNSMGLPNIGMYAAVDLAPDVVARAHDRGKIVIYSGSPANSPDGTSSVEQAARLVESFLETPVDLVELNVSCRNIMTATGRKPILGYDLDAMYELFDVLEARTGGGQNRVGFKLPPYLTEEERAMVPDLANLFLTRKVASFLVTCNTMLRDVPLRNGKPVINAPGGQAGRSGPATKEIGREQLNMWYEHVGGKIDIVSALGVDSGEEVAERLRLGAVAATGVSFLWRSDNWERAVSDMVSQYVNATDGL